MYPITPILYGKYSPVPYIFILTKALLSKLKLHNIYDMKIKYIRIIL